MTDSRILTGASAYRRDIDGLRAIAVLAVVLFHARLPGLTGGFVGVDVFFVISGFLITGIIDREIGAGRFSIAAFYERRIRRIAPALFVMCMATTLACAVWLVPGDLVDYARALLSALFFYANFYFLGQTGYFAPAAEAQPLLHVWSLAVEEQFYLVFPPLLVLAARLGRRRMIMALGVLALASLVAAEVWVRRDPEAAFFLPFTRAWELLLGSLIALARLPPPASAAAREGLAVAGLGMIAAAVTLFRSETPFPGLSALLPCLGAALLLQSGVWGSTAAGRLLSVGPMVYVGRCSYSFYLWHWPLLALATYVEGDIALPTRLALVGAAFLLSVASLHLVEQPIRQRTVLAGRKPLLAAFAGSLALFAGLATVSLVSRGLPQRLPAELAAELAPLPVPRTVRCLTQPTGPGAARCQISGTPGAPADMLLIGDSHAIRIASLMPGLLPGRPVTDAIVGSGCVPAFPDADVMAHVRPDCRGFSTALAKALAANSLPPEIVIASRWGTHMNDPGRMRLAPSQAEHVARLGALVRRLVEVAAHGGQRRVVLVGPVPDSNDDIYRAALIARLAGRVPKTDIPRAAFDARQASVLRLLEDLAKLPGVRVVYPHETLCDATRCRTTDARGIPLYSDTNHLNAAGLAEIREPLAAALR